MSRVDLSPCKLSGKVNIPSSKSIAHRAIICASLAKGVSRISNVTFSDDIFATISAMTALGADIQVGSDYVVVNGADTLSPDNAKIDCNLSGSTLRFVLPIALAGAVQAVFGGKDGLFKRPLNVYCDIMAQQKILYSQGADYISVNGGLKSGVFSVQGDISSQFITGLLFALPLLDGDSTVYLTTPLQSKGYVDLTLQTLTDFGIQIDNQNYEKFVVMGNQKYLPCNYTVEGDFSQAAFFLCADALGANICVSGLNENSLQGDKIIIDILKKMGCSVLKNKSGIKVMAKNLTATTIDGLDCPDIIPALAVVSAVADGVTQFINCERLKIKESDRLSAILENLDNLGIKTEKTETGFAVYGSSRFASGKINTHSDHRMAMAFAIASLMACGDIEIDDMECVSKSYPDFWRDFTNLGGIINER